jgi:hypothetical protein
MNNKNRREWQKQKEFQWKMNIRVKLRRKICMYPFINEIFAQRQKHTMRCTFGF